MMMMMMMMMLLLLHACMNLPDATDALRSMLHSIHHIYSRANDA
jgi:hypothetical protein